MTGRDDGLKNQVAGHLNLDLLNGVSTTKGCYVGQEVYSSYIHHVNTPSVIQSKKTHLTRLVPVVLSSHIHKDPIRMTAENACNDIPSSHLLQEVNGVVIGNEVQSDGKTIGHILYIQPSRSGDTV